MSDPIKVLVVCTGNLCRSPLVAALLDRELRAAGIEAEVTSAGLAAPVGAKPDRRMLKAAREVGIDLDGHRSRQLDVDDLETADVIIGMTSEHVRALATVGQAVPHRVWLLRTAAWKAGVVRGRELGRADWISALADGGDVSGQDLADPIGAPMRSYRAMAGAAQDLTRTLTRAWQRTPTGRSSAVVPEERRQPPSTLPRVCPTEGSAGVVAQPE